MASDPLNGATEPDVLLVSMPFGPLLTPSLGLSLLVAKLRDSGVRTRLEYMTLQFARWIGAKTYSAIATGEPGNHFLLGEWLFRDTLFEAATPAEVDGYLTLLKPAVVSPRGGGQRKWSSFDDFVAEMHKLRAEARRFVKDAAATLAAHKPRIVGFTSVFQQHVASLAVAAELKRIAPEIYIVFGGANCEAEMGLETIRQFRQVDFVVSGEGDDAFPALVKALLAGSKVDIPGVLHRDYRRSELNTGMITSMEDLPYPDYSDFFDQLRSGALDLQGDVPRLLFESSRGCWWGEKHHCTFCGLNGNSMQFRSKSASRAFAELSWMVDKYPDYQVSVVDNILDMKYFRDFIPKVIESDLSVELFYEVKSNLTRHQLELLKQARISHIQPGIESLHSAILKRMRKGVTAVQNLQLLKWCAELGIRPHWNFIWGFPGEETEAYAEMAKLVPLVRHLPAPKSTSSIRLDRFSPNFNEASKLGIADVRPFSAYDYIYPLEGSARARLAYYFDFSYAVTQHVEVYTAEFLDNVRQWQTGEDKYEFFSVDLGDDLALWDFRDIGTQCLTVLSPSQRAIYEACATAKSVDAIASAVSATVHADRGDIEKELERMVERSLVLRTDERYLSLAVASGEDAPGAQGLVQMQAFVKAHRSPESTAEESRLDIGPYRL